ncbi:hypothetical protein GCM10010266_39040 [Streptomyces griseomycini]|uniref:hypothetical protein n=1 Tax=Streptomyces griseomycini TaxID=66895 RepID=UPI0018748B7B|nr:hypothetical protein [Streptomyces griseomycini]GGQ11961.1 hypothetical protein GCM10010266_39040 [Streptomyces griseomycini]
MQLRILQPVHKGRPEVGPASRRAATACAAWEAELKSSLIRSLNRSAYASVTLIVQLKTTPFDTNTGVRRSVVLPGAGLSAACARLADAGLTSIDWTSRKAPATASPTHEGLLLVEEAGVSTDRSQGLRTRSRAAAVRVDGVLRGCGGSARPPAGGRPSRSSREM